MKCKIWKEMSKDQLVLRYSSLVPGHPTQQYPLKEECLSVSSAQIDNEVTFRFVCLFLITQENGDSPSLGKLGSNWDSLLFL